MIRLQTNRTDRSREAPRGLADPLTPLGLAAYRALASMCGRALGSHEAVDSIYVHRSLAAGEIAFARSDIDFAVTLTHSLRGERDMRKLLALQRRLRMLRLACPVLNECEIHEPGEAQQYVAEEPYWGSLVRRSAYFVYGPNLRFPQTAIHPRHAIYRALGWWTEPFHRNLRRRSVRNLRKFAMDAWNAYLTVTGRISEPYLTRAECEVSCRSDGFWERPRPSEPRWRRMARLYFHSLEAIHDAVGLRLSPLAAPIQFSIPGAEGERTVFVMTDADAEMPAEAARPGTLTATPHLLHLLTYYAAPGWNRRLPAELRKLGFQTPEFDAYAFNCVRLGRGFGLRAPGFVTKDPAYAVRRVFQFTHMARWISRGEIPPPVETSIMEALPRPRSITSYYLEHYSRLKDEFDAARELIRGR